MLVLGLAVVGPPGPFRLVLGQTTKPPVATGATVRPRVATGRLVVEVAVGRPVTGTTTATLVIGRPSDEPRPVAPQVMGATVAVAAPTRPVTLRLASVGVTPAAAGHHGPGLAAGAVPVLAPFPVLFQTPVALVPVLRPTVARPTVAKGPPVDAVTRPVPPDADAGDVEITTADLGKVGPCGDALGLAVRGRHADVVGGTRNGRVVVPMVVVGLGPGHVPAALLGLDAGATRPLVASGRPPVPLPVPEADVLAEGVTPVRPVRAVADVGRRPTKVRPSAPVDTALPARPLVANGVLAVVVGEPLVRAPRSRGTSAVRVDVVGVLARAVLVGLVAGLVASPGLVTFVPLVFVFLVPNVVRPALATAPAVRPTLRPAVGTTVGPRVGHCDGWESKGERGRQVPAPLKKHLVGRQGGPSRRLYF